jgi:hypothetical protein
LKEPIALLLYELVQCIVQDQVELNVKEIAHLFAQEVAVS